MTDEMVIPGAESLVHLVARNPVEMQNAQASLKEWLVAKLAGIYTEVKELNAALNEARRNNWATAALTRQRDKAVAQETFYDKILNAVEAGYTIIPDFPVDLFAIRVTRSRVKQPTTTNVDGWSHPTVPDELPDMARIGEGEYKNPAPMVRYGQRKETREGGKEVTIKTTTPVEFQDEIVFPLQAARPVVMSATAEAMALKVFDQIGVCLPVRSESRWAGKGDPLIIGQIVGRKRYGRFERCVSFIIAWHLNLNEL